MAHIQTLSSSIYTYLDVLSFETVESTMPSRAAATLGQNLGTQHFVNNVASGALVTTNAFFFNGTYATTGAAAAATPVIAGADATTVPSLNIARIPSIREYPSIGTPANIVNVPVYGQPTSSQVQGQADAPNLELTVNYIPREMVKVHDMVENQTDLAFRFMITDGPVALINSDTDTLAGTDNTAFFFEGRVEAVLVNPALTDATTAQVTLSAKTSFVGPYTK